MASTYVPYKPAFTVIGNMRLTMGVITTDTSGVTSVGLGLQHIYGGAVTPLAATNADVVYDFDATAGSVTLNSCTTADTFNVMAVGY